MHAWLQRFQKQKVSICHRGRAISCRDSEIGEQEVIGDAQGEAPGRALGAESEEVLHRFPVDYDSKRDAGCQWDVIVDITPYLLQGRRQ